MVFFRIIVCSFAIALTACGVGLIDERDPSSPADPSDGGRPHAGASADSGRRLEIDGGPIADAGNLGGAGLPVDAGTDASSYTDAGGFDAGSVVDAGIDAGLVDAGPGLLVDGGCNPQASPVRFEWPLPGVGGLQWVINNYVDHDAAPGALRDFTGATGTQAKTYDGHRGIDIDVSSFRAMDADFPVIAAAAGVVTHLQDGNFDRNTSCASGPPNLVRVRHDDCSVGLYAHLKKGSVVVALGQRVSVGQVLAVVGSSGCSTQPHLHFELTTANVLEDPFLTGRWRAAPPYAPPLAIMDVNYRGGAYSTLGELKDPAPDPISLDAGVSIGVGANVAGGAAGDQLSMRLVAPNGVPYVSGVTTLSATGGHSLWWWNPTLGTAPGTWRIEVRANGGSAVTRTFNVP